MQRTFFTEGITRKEINEAIRQLVELITTSALPVISSYSAGKDSTVALSMMLRALRIALRLGLSPKQQLHIVLSDTEQETFMMRKLIRTQMKGIGAYVEKYGLPVQVHFISPDVSSKWWSMILGSGQTFNVNPSQSICTDRMKIGPVSKLLDSIVNDYNGYVTVVGTRRSESSKRGMRLSDNTIKGHLKKHDDPRCLLFSPIEYFSESDVWKYLSKQKTRMPWSDYQMLVDLYGDMSSNYAECATLFEGESGKKPGCSTGRSGCHFCPKSGLEDNSVINFNSTDKYPYLEAIIRYRDEVMRVERCSIKEFERIVHLCGGQEGFDKAFFIVTKRADTVSYARRDPVTYWADRDVYNHAIGHPRKTMDTKGDRWGQTSPGGWTLDWRKKHFKKVLALSNEILSLGGDEHIITIEEIGFIQTRWLDEGDYKLTAIKYAQEAGFNVLPTRRQIEFSLLVKAVKVAMTLEHTKEKANSLRYKTKSYFSDRYCAQVAKELLKTGEPYPKLKKLMDGSHEALDTFKGLKANTTQFHPTPAEEEIIRSEWINDRANVITLLSQYENGERGIDTGLFGTFGQDAVLLHELKGFDIMDNTEATLDDFYALMELGEHVDDGFECNAHEESA